MGFLDDAIREHLDLKRRRGADPTEIERAEREALGPVRRDPFADAHDEPGPEISDDAPAGTYDHAADAEYEEPAGARDDWGDAFEEEPVAPAPQVEPAAREEWALSAETRPDEEESFEEEESFAEEEPLAEGRPAPAPHPADLGTGEAGTGDLRPAEVGAGEIDPGDIGAGDQTEEYDVERAFGDEHAHAPGPPAHEESQHGDEDVLEETPEFLQDAPEHDRLWFEQRPPRDFDFDG